MRPKLLKKKNVNETKTISTRIPLSLYRRIEVAREKADQHGYICDLNAALAETAEKFTKAIENELKALDANNVASNHDRESDAAPRSTTDLEKTP